MRTPRRRGRTCAVAGAVLAVTVAACSAQSAHAHDAVPNSVVVQTGPNRTPAAGSPGSLGSSGSSTASPSGSSSPSTTAPPKARVRKADAAITRLTRALGHGGVSVAAVDTGNDVSFAFGARHGMLCASIAKLYILETLLLQHQRGHAALGSHSRALATAMIEHSDNDAANSLWERIGEGRALRRAAKALGVRHTTPGAGIYWGYTRTSAPAYLALLRDLDGPGPLSATSRRYALHLLSHVETDQQWGVGSVADPGTSFALKNGWLPVSTDGGRWAVNSVGLVTVHGQRLLVAVMTQHGSSFDGGVSLVDRLARIAATTVT